MAIHQTLSSSVNLLLDHLLCQPIATIMTSCQIPFLLKFVGMVLMITAMDRYFATGARSFKSSVVSLFALLFSPRWMKMYVAC